MNETNIWQCPYCNGNNLDYGTMELEGEQAYFPRTCCNCWAEGEEWYSLEFSEQYLNKEGHLHNNQKENEKDYN